MRNLVRNLCISVSLEHADCNGVKGTAARGALLTQDDLLPELLCLLESREIEMREPKRNFYSQEGSIIHPKRDLYSWKWIYTAQKRFIQFEKRFLQPNVSTAGSQTPTLAQGRDEHGANG